ncbi:MAG: hypothetical protein ACK5LE_08825, partial [Alphaproteobacteria bacterium]
MKLAYTFLATTAMGLVATAYAQTISSVVTDELIITSASADKEVIITDTGSLSNIDPTNQTNLQNNAIYIDTGTDGAVIQNDGAIHVTV